MNTSPLLIETIRIQKGRVRHIKYHNDRCNKSRKALFQSEDRIDLRRYIDTSKASASEVKCRITYDYKVRNVEYEVYHLRPINSLLAVEADKLSYGYKYKDRQHINALYQKKGNHDDILIVKNGLITDTSYANVALSKNEQWFTPQHPLLQGTTRARLIEKGQIIPAEIPFSALGQYSKICLFNAMIPFSTLVIDLQALNAITPL